MQNLFSQILTFLAGAVTMAFILSFMSEWNESAGFLAVFTPILLVAAVSYASHVKEQTVRLPAAGQLKSLASWQKN
jgi:hypothetical protein